MSDNKTAYISFSEKEETLPLFMQAWWLDAVCQSAGLEWDVALVKDKNGIISAVLTYAYRQKWGIKIITVPPLTKYMGIWQRPLAYPTHHENSNEEQTSIKSLLTQLPDNHRITLQLSPAILDHSVFTWAGYTVETRYMQMLLDMPQIETLYTQLNRNTKRNIKKAEQHFKVETTDDIEGFLQLNNAVFTRQGKQNPISEATWRQLDTVLKEKKQRLIYLSMDENGIAQGVFYMIYDTQYAYALANGLTEYGREQGAMSQLTWQAIQDAAQMRLSFNFLGSMLPTVEAFNRGFNSVKKPYFVLRKSKNLFFDLIFNIIRK
jgi:Acetyltransferase (GNAT) domain